MKPDMFKKVDPVEADVKVETKVEDPEKKILEKAIQETKKVEVSKPYYVTCAKLNVRKEASDKADILNTISSGDKITVDTASARGAWSKITAPITGWVMTKFIAPVK